MLKRLNMLPKMQRSHFVKKYSVQFVNASGKLSAPFYFWDNKPHECSQTWQVVRSEFDQMMLDNAREHGVDAHEGVHVLDVLFEGDRAVGVRIKRAGRTRRDVRAKVVVDASGQAALLQNRLQAARLGSGAEQGRDLDLLGGRLPRHGPRRGRDDGAADRRPEGLVLVHPAARRHRQRRRRGAVRLPVQGARGHEQTYHEEVERCSGGEGRGSQPRSASPATSRRATIPIARRRWPGDGWVLVGDAFGFLDPLYSSGVLLALKSGELAADAIVDGLASRRHERRAARHVGRRRSTRASTACGGWSASTTTASASASSSGSYPDLRGTVTDLLIGDLFTDRVDKVWGPMESLYPPGKHADSDLERGHCARRGLPEKANELILPDGRRP